MNISLARRLQQPLLVLTRRRTKSTFLSNYYQPGRGGRHPLSRRCDCLSGTSSVGEENVTPAAARRARAETVAAKRAQLESLLKPREEDDVASGFNYEDKVYAPGTEEKKESEEKEERRRREAEKEDAGRVRRAEERERLIDEAGFMVRSLYRICFRSVRIMMPGNEKDEMDFREREERQKREIEEVDLAGGGIGIPLAVSPSVDRKNELQSRAEYYSEQIREGFGQETDGFDYDPWRESTVERFVYLLRSAEEQRKYVLGDYEFPDPYSDRFDMDRLARFKESAEKLVADEYKARGWEIQSERDKHDESDDDKCEVFGNDGDFPVK